MTQTTSHLPTDRDEHLAELLLRIKDQSLDLAQAEKEYWSAELEYRFSLIKGSLLPLVLGAVVALVAILVLAGSAVLALGPPLGDRYALAALIVGGALALLAGGALLLVRSRVGRVLSVPRRSA
jgi:peptidoglycan/LPS O-acetylase OafA/YrhL